MNGKMIAVISVVAILVVGGIAVGLILNNKDSDDKEKDKFDEVGLKVLGNINKDNAITTADYDEVKKLVDEGKSAEDYPLADANNDGVLDDKDLEVIDKVIKKESTTIWHINYYDQDSNGTMDRVLVSTKYPVTSTIMTGSTNNFLMFSLLKIPAGDVVKGACYTSSGDTFLFGTNYMDTSKVKNLGSSSQEIQFEDGNGAASELIKAQSVTCLVTDWNRGYIPNESAFEKAGVDVVRIAAASVDKDVYTHTILLMGLLFSQEEQAGKILSLYNSTFDEINEAISHLSSDQKKKAVASSMDGAVSSEDSDYTAVTVAAGAEFGLPGFDFGGSTVIYVADNLGVFDTREYSFDNIVHIRTALTYGKTEAQVAEYWATYANAMGLWEHANDGQVLISGSIPVPCRVAYAAYAIYNKELPSTLTREWADSVLSSYEAYYWVNIPAENHKNLALTTAKYTVTVDPAVVVKDANGNPITSGDKFDYGTELTISAVTEDPDKTLVASGSTVREGGKFYVVNNITARYVQNTELQALSTVASTLASTYSGKPYMQSIVANATAPGSVAFTNEYTTPGTSKTYNILFEYYASEEDAATHYATYKTSTKEGQSGYTDVHEATVYLRYSVKDAAADKDYKSSSTIYMTACYKNIVLKYTGYFTCYDYSAEGPTELSEQQTFYAAKITEFVTAVDGALKAAYA